MIDKFPFAEIIPTWKIVKGSRYMSHPELRTAVIQTMEKPDVVYVVSDQKLPESVAEAVAMVTEWEAAHG